MQFTDFVHMAEGYVTVQAEGVFTERFLNICTHRGLDIWNIRHCGRERLNIDMSISAFKALRPICKRTQTSVKIIKRHGAPFFIHRYRRRKAAVCGIAAALLILWYTSGHIMGITILGNNRITEDVLLENLARSGVALGKTTDNIDPQKIRNRMMIDLDDLAWIGINVSGSRVYVEVVERLEKEQGVDMTKPCNLIALKDGVIDSIEARNGQTVVKPDSGVRAGDVLVSGIMDAGGQGIRYVHSYGEVYAKTRYTLSREYPLEYDEKINTGEKTKRYTVKVLDRSLPLFWSKNEPYPICSREQTEKEYRLPVSSLPSLYVTTETYFKQYTEHRKRSASEALNTATEELEKELRDTLDEGIEQVEREVSSTLTERGTLEVEVTLVCRENIAAESAIDGVDEISE